MTTTNTAATLLYFYKQANLVICTGDQDCALLIKWCKTCRENVNARQVFLLHMLVTLVSHILDQQLRVTLEEDAHAV